MPLVSRARRPTRMAAVLLVDLIATAALSGGEPGWIDMDEDQGYTARHE